MDTQERLRFFRELISCNDKLFSWCYYLDGTLIDTNAEKSPMYSSLFFNVHCQEVINAHLTHHLTPLTISIRMGLMWAVAFQKTKDTILIHVLGPVFSSAVSLDDVRRALAPWEQRGLSLEKRSSFLADIQSLPVLSIENLYRYALMLHYCLNQEKLHFSDIIMQESSSKKENIGLLMAAPDRHRIYMAEQALLQHIREGNLYYKKELDHALSLGIPIGNYQGTPLEQAQLSHLSFISLCARSAIEGGLLPDTAYALADSYAYMVQKCHDFTELQTHFLAMYRDFIHRVHAKKTRNDLSPEISDSLDYIELHIEEPVTLDILSKAMGYSPYYFSRKFKKETGFSLPEYIRNRKLDYAKHLLETTDMSLQDIAERLSFCSRTYFSDHFRRQYGCSPSEYRQKNRQPL